MNLVERLKTNIVTALNLSMEIKDIEDDAPLFDGGMGLDSIDALELVVMLEREYGIVIEERDVAREAFASVRSLAEFIQKNRKCLE